MSKAEFVERILQLTWRYYNEGKKLREYKQELAKIYEEVKGQDGNSNQS